MNPSFELTILMPCLNEENTIKNCILEAQDFLKKNNIVGEILISNNNSTDNSKEIAEKLGARVIDVIPKGYGSALQGGIENSFGKYIIMGDCDESYEFDNLMPFLEKLRDGYDFVMGNRFKGNVEKGAWKFSHQYIGVPILSWIGRILFKTNIGDFHCGLRGFDKEKIQELNLSTTGMEFATEMIAKASKNNLKITEVPTNLRKDGRNKESHLNTFRDGFRHLKFMFEYAFSSKG